ncbi:pyruvate dehydrogenase (acetyl-transferring) E1 component subunit alpha [Microbulbifer hainanensis]|uniref:pyruvate dehydrogenase (acetyl-transferring) E1 component subunit alpha n=1 Tax=Microbulbifer hainanensis TaxID=2735675 RepID=UPI0018686E79|nr:pyruvate dehydrogenase (acetyl-transferring) E1 component subunit alpha [Microbulbifer hainanensis]
MPRVKIGLKYQLEYLSILDESGEADTSLDPDLSKEQLLKFHHAMLLSRRFDEYMLKLQRQGRIGTFAPVKGQEAAQIGAVANLEDDDWLVPAFRETAAAIWRGTPLSGMLLYNAGYNEGGRIPDEQNDLPIAIPVGSQIPHAVGIAYGCRYQDTDRVALTFFGDGATSEGPFHEALNLAMLFETPTIFVCQNNHWAISTPRDRQTRSETIAQKAIAYGMPGIQVDGNDVLAVYCAVREAVQRARDGDGPTLVECVTYRMEVHTTADDPTRYRDEEQVEQWAKRDPIERLQKYLKHKEMLTDEDIEKDEKEIEQTVKQAWQDTKEQIDALSDASVIFEYLYAGRPPYLEEQREGFVGGQDNG